MKQQENIIKIQYVVKKQEYVIQMQENQVYIVNTL